ncbi:zinc ribbon domain-containing protein [bacterium]|jgi:putative FmdB family regulatory protein|nr:zinc ribbon domain-containing protein [bacterium]
MPIYEYQHTDGTGEGCTTDFEAVQNMSESSLTNCPRCKKPVVKKISLPAHHQGSVKDKLSDQNLSKHGFSKYVKAGDGSYEKAAGPDEAPATIYK